MAEFSHPDNFEKKSPDGYDRVADEIEEFIEDIVTREDDKRFDRLQTHAEDEMLRLFQDIAEAESDIDEAKDMADEMSDLDNTYDSDDRPEELYHALEDVADRCSEIWDTLFEANRQINNTSDEIIEKGSKWKAKAGARSREIDEFNNFLRKFAYLIDRTIHDHNHLLTLYKELYFEYKNLKAEKEALETQLQSYGLRD